MMTFESLEVKTVKELRVMASNMGITGISKAKKDHVIEAIIEVSGAALTDENLNAMTLVELRALARDMNITGVSKVSKAEIVDSIMANGSTEIRSITGIEAHASGSSSRASSIKISSGASSGRFPVAGRSVAQIKDFLGDVLNIDKNSNAVVNGEKVSNSYELEEGDSLEFVKRAGTKG